MPAPYIIGIDLGSQTTKSCLYDMDGALIGETSQPIGAHYPKPGWVEQDPHEVYQTVLQTVRRLITTTQIAPQEILAIGLDSQIGSMIRIDSQGNALGPIECEVDARCHPQQDAMMNEYGELVLELNGIFPYFAPKLMWWRQENPDEYQKTYKALTVTGYIASRLAGLSAENTYTDYTCIGIYGLSDVRNYQWSEELLERTGIAPEKLPRIVRPWDIIGELTSEAAAACGLVAGIPLVAGLGDAIAGWLGVGAVESGTLVDTSGTSNHLAFCVDQFRPDVKDRVLSHYPSAIPGLWYAIGYTAGTGRTHNWYIDEFCLTSEQRESGNRQQIYHELEEAAALIAPGSEGLMLIPHLSGRVCPYEPNVRGAWLGFTWKHTRNHFYRALLEAIAYEFHHYLVAARRLYPEVAFRQVVTIGGGAKSKLWLEIKADVLGLPYTTPSISRDYAPLGAAIIAGHGVGLFDDIAATAKRFTSRGATVSPREPYHAFYEQHARFYDENFRLMDETFAGLASLAALPSPNPR